MARAFRCNECGTGFSTTREDVPPSPKWADGHVCKMVEVESKLGLFEPTKMNVEKMSTFTLPCVGHSEFSDQEDAREVRMKHIGQNGNDGLHYGEEDDFNG